MGRIIIFVGLLAGLSACGDPLRNVDRLSVVAPGNSVSTAGLAEAPSEAAPRNGGLFSGMLNRRSQDPTNAAIEAALADVSAVESADQPTEDSGEEIALLTNSEEPSPRGAGLLGLFGRNRAAAEPPADPETVSELDDALVMTSEEPTADTAEDTGAAVIEAAAVETSAPASEVETPHRRGLGRLLGRRAPDVYTGPDAQIVEAGTILPLGDIARVCDLPANRRGTQIAKVAGFKIYDTIPNSNAARPHYITGFDDNCARTFTAAVVIPSDIDTHEFMRYTARSDAPYSEVDNAYEALKASVCRVGRGQPCGARSDRLGRSTHFLTVYGNFGSPNSVWADILLHEGAVLASTATGL